MGNCRQKNVSNVVGLSFTTAAFNSARCVELRRGTREAPYGWGCPGCPTATPRELRIRWGVRFTT